MSKRFTDTDKYKKPFIRSLPGAYKLLWDYLYLECDHAGVWIVDFEIAQIYIGADMPISEGKALELFNKGEQRIIPFDNGKKWFIPPFIEFQYGELNPSNRVHNSVISRLKKENLYSENKGLASPLQGAKDKDMDKDKDKDMDKDKDAREKNSEDILDDLSIPVIMNKKSELPLDRVNECPVPEELQYREFIEKYQFYCKYMQENHRIWPTSTTTELDLHKLNTFRQAGHDPVLIIEQTIQARNKSFYELKNFKNNGNNGRKTKGDDRRDTLKQFE